MEEILHHLGCIEPRKYLSTGAGFLHQQYLYSIVVLLFWTFARDVEVFGEAQISGRMDAVYERKFDH